ncbi:MAG: TaqI-like C-terminal specificity domain-containing protein [Chloroflexota bacterium]|nr:TaqI-like C-terminal specificity domain-containing protein [Chloroflexota bacterium]
MPIANRQDATDVEQDIVRFFAAPPSGRAQALRRLFVEKLDFAGATGTVSLANAPKTVALPASAERIASMEGMHVVYVPLSGDGPDRIRKAEASAAAKLITDALHGDILLVMTNPSCSQLHVIYPTFAGATPSLRRMIIERDLPRRTAVQQLSEIYWEYDKTKSIAPAVDRAFDVEAVTKDFFEKYREVFKQVEELIQGFTDAEKKRLFTQTLFNRLMFIYFLSRKGWLTFNGNPDYLNTLRKDYPAQSEDKNFYNSRLKALFFAGLNNERSTNFMRDNPAMYALIGDVPFLNGGLFDMTDADKRPNVVVPDAAIDQILHDLFDHFNFTVMESTPFDMEVAVDPEMLGKVFEELVTGRHESGSYYTPRPVVAFMCREALKGYLQGTIPSLPPEAIGQFVDQRDVSGLNLTTAGMVRRALEQIKVVDPACGSGAYLLGILHELVDLETVLYNEKLVTDPKSLYELKLRIIEENVYGADIDQFAVNVAMLRLWLSLSIEYDGYPPPALPNLDFKIVRGDSLTAPDPNPSVHGAQYQMFREQVHAASGRLAKLKHQHMNAVDPEKRMRAEEIQKELANLRMALTFAPAPKDAVDWRVTFAEVFADGGFDIVVTNPPYLRHEVVKRQFGDHYKDSLVTLYPEACVRTADIYVAFYARAHQLLKQNGGSCFISSNKWLRASYGEKLRQHLLDSQAFHLIVDFAELPVFQAATFPAIFHWQKQLRGDTPTTWAVVKDLQSCYDDGIREHVTRIAQTVPASQFGKNKARLASPTAAGRRTQMEASGPRLGELVKGRIYFGIKTGLNEAFIIDRATRDRLIEEDPMSAEIIKPLLVGDDVRRYEAHFRERYLIWTYIGVPIRRYPAIFKHLNQFQEKAEKRSDQGDHWWELRACDYYDAFDRPKIIYPDIAKETRFVMDANGYYVEATAFIIPTNDWFLLGVLNSASAFEYVKLCASVLGDEEKGGRVRFKTIYVGTIPIPDASMPERETIAKLVEGAHRLHNERRNRVEQFLQHIAISPAEFSSRNPLQQPWQLSQEELQRRGKGASWQLTLQAQEKTAALTEQIAKIEHEIDERMAHLYGVG